MSDPKLFNTSETTWIEFGIALLVSLLTILVMGLVRYLSSRVLRADMERTLLDNMGKDAGHVIIGASRILLLLGAPHTVRTRKKFYFVALLLVILAYTSISIAPGAFGSSRRLREGEPTTKVTAVPGEPVLNEDELIKFADWFRSSGVVSLCQRRRGSERVYYQPYVEKAAETRVYCGKSLDVTVPHESDESIEKVRPSQLVMEKTSSVSVSTPSSTYVSHEINILGTGLTAVCNSGEYYRGVRSGRVTQSCAFTSKTHLFLGGYMTNSTQLSGPGPTPSIDDIIYFDSYKVELGTELTIGQLVQALTIWDLGSMPEVEVAVLATLRFELTENVPSFTGGFNSYEYDVPMVAVSFSVVAAVILVFLVYLLWDSYNHEERLESDPSTLDFISRTIDMEARKEYGLAKEIDSNPRCCFAIRDVTDLCGAGEEGETGRKYHLGSARIGAPVSANAAPREVVESLNKSA